MRKTFLKVSLLAVLGLGMSASFTSCKDYDGDIDNLQDQINQLNSKVAEIEAAVKGGAVITNVAQNGDGITFTLSNGQNYTVKNGKDGAAGKDADVWTIVKNAEGEYVWAKNGTATEYPAQGPAGEDGTALPGVYYKPDEKTGKFVIVDPATGKEEPTDISWKGVGGGLTAIATGDKVVISGIVNDKGEAQEDITIYRSMFIKSLVVVPQLYLDGIETTRYQVVEDVEVIKTKTAAAATAVVDVPDASQGAVIAKGEPVEFENVKDAYDQQVYYYENQIATLGYHVNPSNAAIEGMKWNLLIDNKEVVNRGSYVSGEVLGQPVLDKNGDITVTYQLDGTKYLAPYDYKTGAAWDNDDKWTMMALQVANPETDSALVASNNVVIAKEVVDLVHLAVAQAPASATIANKGWKQTWDKAELAIRVAKNDNGNGSTLATPAEVLTAAYNANYDLASHIAIEATYYTPMIDGKADAKADNEQNTAAGTKETKILSLAEAAKKFNLKANYELVTYTINPNKTSEDQFAKINAETGVITPCYVTSDGQQVEIPGTAQGRSAIGRKPMVYVTLSAGEKIVLAGFVKLVYTEAAKVLPGIVLDKKSVPYICDYTVASTWEQITGAVYEQIGVTPEEFSKYFVFEENTVYELVGDNMVSQKAAFKAQYGTDAMDSFNLGTFKWDKNENGTHTQELSLNIKQANYQSWYPTFYNGKHNGYSVTTASKSKTLYAKFYNETNNTTVYIGFEVNLIGAPAANYDGKLLSQWSDDQTVAPINPAVPGQTTDETPVQEATGYDFAAAMSMNFTSVWIGGQPALTGYNDLYNFTDAKKPYLLQQYPAQYRFAAKQDNVFGTVPVENGKIGKATEYAIGTFGTLWNSGTRLGTNTQALYAAAIDENGNADKDNAQPIAVITSSNELPGIAAKAEALNEGSTKAPWRWEVISMLPYYNTSANSTAPYTPAYTKNIGSGWKYAEFACDIVNAKRFNKNAPEITFNVEMTVNYGQVATAENGAYLKDEDGNYQLMECVLVIPGSYALEVGVGRPVSLGTANTGELQDAVNGSVLASRLFTMVDWQGHLLWNTSRTGKVTYNGFNGVDNLADFWLSQNTYKVQQWPNNVTFANGDAISEASIVVDLANALVGEDTDVAKNLGLFSKVYVDKKLTLVGPDCVANNVATITDVADLDDITIEWTNNGSAVTKNIYVFVPISINYVWGQNMFLGYATITVKPTLSE